jgi:putative membrane protein
MGKTKILGLEILATLFFLPVVLAHGDDDYSMMSHMWGFDLGWPGMFIMFLFWVLFWGAILYLVYTLIRKLSNESKPHHRKRKPLDLAKRRFATGEITKKEYIEIKKELEE